MVDSTEVVTSAAFLYLAYARPARHPTPSTPVASQSGMPEVVTNSRQISRLSTSSNCHFLKMAMTMMSFPQPITRPHTPITQQLCLRLYFYGLPLSLMRVNVKDRSKIGHFEHGLTIRNGIIHRISEIRHKDLTAAVNALLSAVKRAFLRSKNIFTAVDISSSCAADEALKQLSTLQTCHDKCNNQLAAS
eukprot:scaffold6990_cov87-Skeletonema_dohrnii-CCMP3373.AAC.5